MRKEREEKIRKAEPEVLIPLVYIVRDKNWHGENIKRRKLRSKLQEFGIRQIIGEAENLWEKK